MYPGEDDTPDPDEEPKGFRVRYYLLAMRRSEPRSAPTRR